MIHFKKLRLNGFKSFVERTELDIEPGLTGVVGPNGCGKSNLVEALRWVMGENSAKRMRGDGMEDVIFNGTSTRSARNFAEVSLLLDNSERTGPPAFNGGDEIEVTRKIEREQGSAYRINGRMVRARDVQLLFADTVSGANSPALVSQGRVTAMINAKPAERRLILEESAGISGLYARRHEAELRLRAADANLARIQDVLGSMESRLGELKKQARQATRYRNVSAQIRQLEIFLSLMEWRNLHERVAEARRSFAEAESRVADRLGAVTQLTSTQNTQAADLPALRQTEAEAAARYQAQKLALQRLEDEEKLIENQIAETGTQLHQTGADSKHESRSLEDNAATLTRLEEEVKIIVAEQDGEGDELEQKEKIRDELEVKAQELESEYTALMEGAAEVRARRQSLEQQIAQGKTRLESLRRKRDDTLSQLERKREQQAKDNAAEGLRAEIQTLEGNIEQTRASLDKMIAAQRDAEKALEICRGAVQKHEAEYSAVATEIRTLKSILDVGASEFRPVIDDIRTDEGFEAALSKALGDFLGASTDMAAPVSWAPPPAALPDLPALPAGCRPLIAHVKAPEALKLALSQIGFIENDTDGGALAAGLKAGQSIVSRNGAYWRWDGLRIKAAAVDRHAAQLRHKNRLAELEKQFPAHEQARDSAKEKLELAKTAHNEAQTGLRTLRQQLDAYERTLGQKRTDLNRAVQAQAGTEAEIARLEESLNLSGEEIGRLETELNANTDKLAEIDEKAVADKYEQIEQMRASLRDTREALRNAIRAFDLCRQQQDSRKARLHAIADERLNLQNRAIRAREHLKTLGEREQQLKEKLAELKTRPKEITSQREALLTTISTAETARAVAAERLAACESELAETTRALKSAEAELSSAREARAHAQALVAAGQEQLQAIVQSVHDKFEMTPEALASEAAIDLEGEATGSIDELRQRREKLVRERDGMGPVNLMADNEATELESQLGGLLNERNDLIQAIEELRGGINTLNKEARERLNAAFGHVNGHFQKLFGQLFAGGSAHLALIDSDDPLEAGLEIFAQPPGKSLQSLSLLSGGEQTLASTALIFAMFLTNPSPICVLDEIDAPLDDANVDRVCDLLDEICESVKTRFIIITHHRLTMARMDRLYGVTMAERGISQLVSVDLQQSFAFMDAAE